MNNECTYHGPFPFLRNQIKNITQIGFAVLIHVFVLIAAVSVTASGGAPHGGGQQAYRGDGEQHAGRWGQGKGGGEGRAPHTHDCTAQ